MAYTKEFLVSAFLSRYISLSTEKFEELENMAESFYDEVGRDKFRVYCSLDAEALKVARDSGFCT
jgi:hypothetical protein